MKNKENLSQTAAAIRQRKRRAAASLDEHETRLTNDRENKRIKKSLETSKQREARLTRNRKQKQKERGRHILETADVCLNCQDEPLSDNLHKIYPVCNEFFPSITLVLRMCHLLQ